MRSSTLERRTGLRRTGWLRSIPPKKRRENRAKKAVREAVFARDGGCLLSPWAPLNKEGRDWGPCLGPLTPHHLLKASQGGAFTEENLVTTCSMHNSMIEDFPDAAHSIGLVVKSWEAR